MRQFQNKYTKEKFLLLRIDTVESYPKPIKVYVLDNGKKAKRWDEELLFKHHVEIDESPDYLEQSI